MATQYFSADMADTYDWRHAAALKECRTRYARSIASNRKRDHKAVGLFPCPACGSNRTIQHVLINAPTYDYEAGWFGPVADMQLGDACCDECGAC